MTKVISKVIAVALAQTGTILLYLWIGWWTVLVFSLLPIIYAAGRWALRDG